jgi:hypothetical protein
MDYPMSIKANDELMFLESEGRVLATAEFRHYVAADGHGPWIVSSYPNRLFIRNQAITAVVLAERFAVGYGKRDLRHRVARGTRL